MELHKAKWSICAVAEKQDTGGHSTCMDLAPGGRKADRDNLGATLDFAVAQKQGLKALGSHMCHCVSDKDEIWQVTKGRLRLLWFYGEGEKIVICCNLHLKKGQKVNPDEVAKAVKFRDQYFSDMDAGNIIFLDDEEHDHGK
jgi:hypothetical protein